MVADIDFPKYMKTILSKDTDEARVSRRAFGLPLNASRSRGLMTTLSSKEPIAGPLISLLAQRFYHFIWRFRFTLREINDSHADKTDLLAKTALLCTICLKYVLAERPSPLDLVGSLSRPMPESAADPSLYTTLRALEYEREEKELVITQSEREEFREAALNSIQGWLERALEGTQKVDDFSNVWWALREGLCAGSDPFMSLIGPVAKKYGSALPPPQGVTRKSFVPEIYTDTRCGAYILSNIHAIIREGPPLDTKLEKNLDTIVTNMLKTLMENAESKNLYLASVQHEGLTRALSLSAEKQFRKMRVKGQINLADFKPVGDFVCVEPGITHRIGQLKDWLKSTEVKNGRGAVLFYGASSTGKSFLVEQFFKVFGRTSQYSENQLICASETRPVDVLAHVAKISANHAPGSPIPFILLDEFDVEMAESLYPSLLVLLEKGFLERNRELKSFVLFLAGGKHGSVEGLRQFLAENQKKKKAQKGIDVYNRIDRDHKIGLPMDLYRNKNLRMMVGLSVLLQEFGPSIKVSTSLLLHIREMRVDQGEGVRQFKSLKGDVEKSSDGTLVLRGDLGPTNPITVVAGK